MGMAKIHAHVAGRSPTAFLQVVLVLFGAGVLAFLLVMPHFEGRNAHATVFEVYFKDPFLAFAYVASIPFFAGLWHGFKVLGCVGRGTHFSQEAVRSLRIIKYCAIAIIGFVLVSVAFMMNEGDDDRPQGVMMRLLVCFASVVVASAAATFERILQKAVDLKAENDLTV